jgi:hypothetical protein
MMDEIERHTSPDGLLTLVVYRDNDHGTLIALDDFPWRTHGDLLAPEYGESPEAATRAFVDMILSCQLVIVISRAGSEVWDISITDDPDYDDEKYAAPDETIEKRFWDGTPYTGRGLGE